MCSENIFMQISKQLGIGFWRLIMTHKKKSIKNVKVEGILSESSCHQRKSGSLEPEGGIAAK